MKVKTIQVVVLNPLNLNGAVFEVGETYEAEMVESASDLWFRIILSITITGRYIRPISVETFNNYFAEIGG